MRVIDSHTEGEPTRVIVEGGPDLGAGSMRERIELLGGSFRLESASGRGCAVFARLPVRYSYAV